MYQNFQTYLQDELSKIEDAGLYKKERIIVSPQGSEIILENGKKLRNF